MVNSIGYPLAKRKIDELTELTANLVTSGRAVNPLVNDLIKEYQVLVDEVKGYTPLTGRFIEMSELLPEDVRLTVIDKFHNFSSIINVTYTEDNLVDQVFLSNKIAEIKKYIPDVLMIKTILTTVNSYKQSFNHFNMLATGYNDKTSSYQPMIEILDSKSRLIVELLAQKDVFDRMEFINETIRKSALQGVTITWI